MLFLKLYQILTIILGPFIHFYLWLRMKKGKEDIARFNERLGVSSILRPKGALIWFHAASVGESISVIPLIQKLAEENEDLYILLTTGTISSAALIETRLPDKTFHQYAPIDRISVANKFLKHWRPDLALWVESELWPNLITQTAKYCPMMLINARISDESFSKWSKFQTLGSHLLTRFSLIFPQSKADETRLKNLGARQIKYYGNIKFDSPALPSDPKKMGDLVSDIKDRPVWLATSTHPNEEELIAKVHQQIKEAFPSLLTIIAPRHPKRSEEIISQIKALGLNVATRSYVENIDESTDIYLADTIGELGIFYRLVSIVFIGGSLVSNGGQNPLEAARLECAIIFGKHMENFIEIRDEFIAKNAAVEVSDANELKNTLEELLSDHDKQHKLAELSLSVVKEKSGIIDAYINDINPYLEKIKDDINQAKIS